MMKIALIPYRGHADLQRVIQLTQAYPQCQRHVADLPYRLASWALDTPDNVHLWEDERERLLGFAIVQGPWLALDYGQHPDARAAGLEAQIIAWGCERAQTIADRRGQPFTMYVEAHIDDQDRIALLTTHGFEAGGYRMLHFERPLPQSGDITSMAVGFRIRPLRDDTECPAYVDMHRAAFGTTNMTLEWRQRTLLTPGYIPELDLVVEAPDGRLAAFCIGWLNNAYAQVEPMGVHPDYQRLGLGSAILHEMFRCMHAHGARAAVVETYADDEAAVALYQSVGFKLTAVYTGLSREFTPRRTRQRSRRVA